MTRRQRNNVVEARAALILGGEFTIEEYAVHFETQMHRGIVRKILSNSYLYFARAGAILLGFDPAEIM